MSHKNTITLTENGPIILSGDIKIVNSEGTVLHHQNEAALCRCGASSNKPFCDGSHSAENYNCDTTYNAERLETDATEEEGGELSIKLFPNGPALIEGTYEVIGGSGERTNTKKKMSFCRCGASGTTPFCDGNHKPIGFIAD